MGDRVQLSDEALGVASAALLVAENCMSSQSRVDRLGHVASLTGIGGDVQQFLSGVSVARAALADAARTASQAVAGVMRESTALDTQLATSLSSEFAVAGGPR